MSLKYFRNVTYPYKDQDDTFIARGLHLNMLVDQVNGLELLIVNFQPQIDALDLRVTDLETRVDAIEGDYVTLTTTQTITGVKTFETSAPAYLATFSQLNASAAGVLIKGTGVSSNGLLKLESGAVTDLLTVTHAGNIGIGTAFPISPLHVKGAVVGPDEHQFAIQGVSGAGNYPDFSSGGISLGMNTAELWNIEVQNASEFYGVNALVIRDTTNDFIVFNRYEGNPTWWTDYPGTSSPGPEDVIEGVHFPTGDVVVAALAGVGERGVVADADGRLKIGSGGSHWDLDTPTTNDITNNNTGFVYVVNQLIVRTALAGDTEILAQTLSDANNSYAGMHFKVSTDTINEQKKGAIIYRRSDTFGRGNMHFLQSNAASINNTFYSTTEVAMTISNDRNVGIGTVAPTALLHVETASASSGTTVLNCVSAVGNIFNVKADGSFETYNTAVASGTDAQIRIISNVNGRQGIIVKNSNSTGDEVLSQVVIAAGSGSTTGDPQLQLYAFGENHTGAGGLAPDYIPGILKAGLVTVYSGYQSKNLVIQAGKFGTSTLDQSIGNIHFLTNTLNHMTLDAFGKLSITTDYASNFAASIQNTNASAKGLIINLPNASSLGDIAFGISSATASPVGLFGVDADGTVFQGIMKNATIVAQHHQMYWDDTNYWYLRASSDVRLKQNITSFDKDALKILSEFSPKTFEAKATPGEKIDGWIAQEGVEHIPVMFPLDKKSQLYGINDGRILPYYHKAIIQLLARIEELENK